METETQMILSRVQVRGKSRVSWLCEVCGRVDLNVSLALTVSAAKEAALIELAMKAHERTHTNSDRVGG